MARTVREAALGTRSARLRLPVFAKPYCRVIEQGLHLGYRRRSTGGSWIARRRNDEGIYRETKLGLADDLQEANGESIPDFSRAQRAARTCCGQEQRLAAGRGSVPDGPHTVARAMADYLQDYRCRGGKSVEGIEIVVNHSLVDPTCDATDLPNISTILPVWGSISALAISSPALLAALMARFKSVGRKAHVPFDIVSPRKNPQKRAAEN
jgi:hypothetical protein